MREDPFKAEKGSIRAFLRGVLLSGRFQQGQQLGRLGAVGRGVMPGHAGVFNEERGAVQGGVCGFYGNHLLVKSDRLCYNNGR